MKKIFYTLPIIILSLFLFTGWSMPSFWRKKKAINLYKKEEYSKALDIYQDLQIAYPYKADINYNEGNILYRLERYEEAENMFRKAFQSKDKKILKNAHYNIGNTLYRQDKLEEAIKSYEETLKIDSTDQDAKYNIELIRKKLEKKQQKEQQQTYEDKNDKRKQEKKEDKEKQDDQNKENKKQDKQKTSGENKPEDQENKSDIKSKAINKQEQKNDAENRSEQDNDEKSEKPDTNKKEKNSPVEKAKREQAKQILDAIKHDEKKLKQIINKNDGTNNQEEKVKYDW